MPNANNAHLNLQSFEEGLRSLAKESRNSGISDEDIVDRFYHRALGCLNKLPDEPGDDQLLCRYLTPKKFLWFASQKSLRFCKVAEFDDPRECFPPEDYDNSVRKILHELSLPPEQWDKNVWGKGEDWLVSCWTTINEHHDDSLIWHKYAEGPEGVGITIRYGQLKSLLRKNIDPIDVEQSIKAGLVNYKQPLRLLPFNKRLMFRNEAEVRFTFRHIQYTLDYHADVSGLLENFVLRFSQDAPEHHIEAVRSIWKKCGGSDHYQIPDG